MTRFATVFRVGAPLVVVAVLVAWWQLATRHSPSLYVKAPSEIADALRLQVGERDLVTENLWPTVRRVAAGWTLAAVTGIGLGLLLGRVRSLRPWVAPALHIGRAVPPPALIGILFVSFGPGDGPKVTLVFVAALFPILFNTMEGAESVEPLRLDVAAAAGLGWATRVGAIILPSAAPRVLAGLRSSSSIALIVVVTAEYTGSADGLGRVMSEAQNSFRWVDVWVVLVVLAMLALAMNAGLVAAERRVLRWHRAEGGGTDG